MANVIFTTVNKKGFKQGSCCCKDVTWLNTVASPIRTPLPLGRQKSVNFKALKAEYPQERESAAAQHCQCYELQTPVE